ncbi:aminoglycoside phosphotransferase family protein [Pseudoalteromonas umbrosa]|uniref:aminoglycoside phosphotransferase family protein n=1 Tax=Pseudoalteromonas umbrosa TaxID=3048489 RepID=UPI0024C3CBB9|nr:phosphotransferase [Pseudoalteromonas sp. B95]MDK1287069.1 phosphotransferase [Pseudoalteromonas sp. B95]
MASFTPSGRLKREHHRQQFIETQITRLLEGAGGFDITAITGDASFRLYFRVQAAHAKFILMDVPPEKGTISEFVHLNDVFSEGGLLVPEVLAFDNELGFVLLEDLGATHLADLVESEHREAHYLTLLSWLPKIAKLPASEWMREYDLAFILQEMDIFRSWLLEKWLDYSFDEEEVARWQHLTQSLAGCMLTQPQVVMHRDFHSRNVMFQQEKGRLIDYQDAVVGPICYDAVSLLKDCYVKLPADELERLKKISYQQLSDNGLLEGINYDQYIDYFNLTGLQRHLKAAGIFVRLYLRDGKPGYLPNILPTLDYIVEAANAYTDYQWLATWLQSEIMPMVQDKLAESL